MTVSIIVTNTKGGCSKTMIATNLASVFANAGFVIGLADVDRQNSSLGWLVHRPGSAPRIVGLDWRMAAEKPLKKLKWPLLAAFCGAA